jgi:proteasome beta subunit
MVKANLPMVFQGLVIMPLYVGYDVRRQEGRIFKYDITGGRYEESEYHAIGSGGKDARNTIREHYRVGLAEEDALRIGLSALFNAADEDVGTGGPDLIRGIYPTAKTASASGIVDVTDDRIKAVYESMMADRSRGK